MLGVWGRGQEWHKGTGVVGVWGPEGDSGGWGDRGGVGTGVAQGGTEVVRANPFYHQLKRRADLERLLCSGPMQSAFQRHLT